MIKPTIMDLLKTTSNFVKHIDFLLPAKFLHISFKVLIQIFFAKPHNEHIRTSFRFTSNPKTINHRSTLKALMMFQDLNKIELSNIVKYVIYFFKDIFYRTFIHCLDSLDLFYQNNLSFLSHILLGHF